MIKQLVYVFNYSSIDVRKWRLAQFDAALHVKTVVGLIWDGIELINL
jgi:hypothetical protein